jgi:hypothetical protein
MSFCTPVPTSLAESSTSSLSCRPNTPPFALTSATAYLAPSTSVAARADSEPVSGLTMPILIGTSPRAPMMNGEVTCNAPSAAPALISERRPMPNEAFVSMMSPCCGP